MVRVSQNSQSRAVKKTARTRAAKASGNDAVSEIRDLVHKLLQASSDRNDSIVDMRKSVDKLAETVSELKNIQSLSSQTVGQQEKRIDAIFISLESFKSKTEDDFQELEQSTNKQIGDIRDKVSEQFSGLIKKIDSLEKYIWMAVGGISAATWIVMALLYYFKVSY
jgi:phage-related protein